MRRMKSARLLPIARPARRASGARPIPIAVALQGGGALGAFSWGVLDRLLDESRLHIAVVSGASAGAMNAAMLVQGLASGGPAEAKRLLAAFWRRVALAAGHPDFGETGWLASFTKLFDSVSTAVQQAAHALPSIRQPALQHNPLRAVLDELLDVSAFGTDGAPTLIVSATRVRTGEARLFQDREVTADVLLASACLPQLFPAVEIDGEGYWDGGYVANPPVRTLIEAGAPADVLIVSTRPLERPEMPIGAADIQARSAEVAFGSALRQELRTLAVAQRLVSELPSPPPADSGLARLRDARLHLIGAEETLRALPMHSAMDTHWSFLKRLHDLGHHAADEWLSENAAAIGVRPTLDLGRFVGPPVLLPDAGSVPSRTR